MTTKEQERKALEQIKKILAGLDEDSYVATAMQGMIRDAEDNIEYDAAYSMSDRWYSTQQKLNAAEDKVSELAATVEALENENKALKAAVMTVDEIGDIQGLVADYRYVCAAEAKRMADKIVEFAEEPQGLAFKEAVAENRRAAASEEKCSLVLEMLCGYEAKAYKL